MCPSYLDTSNCKKLLNKAFPNWKYADKIWIDILDDTEKNLKIISIDESDADARKVLTFDAENPMDGNDVTLEDRLVDNTQKWERVQHSSDTTYFFLENLNPNLQNPSQNYLTASSDTQTTLSGIQCCAIEITRNT